MGLTRVEPDQSKARQVIASSDTTRYAYEIEGADVLLGTNQRTIQDNSVRARKGDTGTLQTPEGVGLWAELPLEVESPGSIHMVPGLSVGTDPRRGVERPKDEAVRAGQSKVRNFVGTGLTADSSSKEYTLADNTSAGVYRLQTINLSETSGSWSENITVEIRLEDDTGAVTERLEANISQLPWDFDPGVSVPSSFTAKGVVHNLSASGIDYRLNAAYTKEVLK